MYIERGVDFYNLNVHELIFSDGRGNVNGHRKFLVNNQNITFKETKIKLTITHGNTNTMQKYIIKIELN